MVEIVVVVEKGSDDLSIRQDGKPLGTITPCRGGWRAVVRRLWHVVPEEEALPIVVGKKNKKETAGAAKRRVRLAAQHECYEALCRWAEASPVALRVFAASVKNKQTRDMWGNAT